MKTLSSKEYLCQNIIFLFYIKKDEPSTVRFYIVEDINRKKNGFIV